jgi:hypothetical protein
MATARTKRWTPRPGKPLELMVIPVDVLRDCEELINRHYRVGHAPLRAYLRELIASVDAKPLPASEQAHG